MRKRQFLLPCGRVVYLKRYDYRDILERKKLTDVMRKYRKQLDAFVSWENERRYHKQWCKATYSKFITLLLNKLADHLMQSDRIETKKGRYWMIGNAKDGTQSNKFVNFHTSGKVYGVMVSDIQGYRMSMSYKRRKELQKRILSGQKFH